MTTFPPESPCPKCGTDLSLSSLSPAMGNDDFVRDDLEDRVRKMALELPPSDLASTRAIQHITKFVRSLLSAAPPSAPSGDNVSTPSEHGSSAAAAGKSREVDEDDLEPGELRPCPFCGGEAERIDFDDVDEEHENAGGSCIGCTNCGASSPVVFGYKETLHSSWNERSRLQPAAASEADNVSWNADRQRFFEARDALYQFKYPPDPKLLREIADEIDCGNDCAHGYTEWDSNAHVCSRSDSKEGCASEKASCLRQFADAIDVRSRLQPAAASNVSTPSEHGSSAAAAGKSRDGFQARHEQIEEDHLAELKRRRQWWASCPGEDGKALNPDAQIVPFDTLQAAIMEIEYHRSRLQPAAASEGASPEAVSTKSNDVAEMVERLTKTLDWYGKHYFNTIPEARTLTYDRCMALSRMCTESASLLQSLARERERLLYDLGSIANQCKVADDPEHMTLALVRKIAEHAIPRSALKGT